MRPAAFGELVVVDRLVELPGGFLTAESSRAMAAGGVTPLDFPAILREPVAHRRVLLALPVLATSDVRKNVRSCQWQRFRTLAPASDARAASSKKARLAG